VLCSICWAFKIAGGRWRMRREQPAWTERERARGEGQIAGILRIGRTPGPSVHIKKVRFVEHSDVEGEQIPEHKRGTIDLGEDRRLSEEILGGDIF